MNSTICETKTNPNYQSLDIPQLTTKNLIALTSSSATTINAYIAKGILTPKSNGRGPGPHLRWTYSDVFAVVAGHYYRDAGFDKGFVMMATKLLADLGSKVGDEIDKRNTWLSVGSIIKGVHIPGRLIPPPPEESLTEAAAQLLVELDIKNIVQRFWGSMEMADEIDTTSTEDDAAVEVAEVK